MSNESLHWGTSSICSLIRLKSSLYLRVSQRGFTVCNEQLMHSLSSQMHEWYLSQWETLTVTEIKTDLPPMSGRSFLSYSFSKLLSISVASVSCVLGASIWFTVTSSYSSSYSIARELHRWNKIRCWNQPMHWAVRCRLRACKHHVRAADKLKAASKVSTISTSTLESAKISEWITHSKSCLEQSNSTYRECRADRRKTEASNLDVMFLAGLQQVLMCERTARLDVWSRWSQLLRGWRERRRRKPPHSL